MLRFKLRVFAILVLPHFALACPAQSVESDEAKRVIESFDEQGNCPACIDPKFSPGADLFNYANGNLLRATTIPAGSARWGLLAAIGFATKCRLRSILEHQGEKPESVNLAKARIFYRSFLNTEQIEKLGTGPLDAQLAVIQAAVGPRDLVRAFASLNRIGVAVALNPYVEPLAQSPRTYALHLFQGGLGLGNRSNYLDPMGSSQAFIESYIVYVSELLQLAGLHVSAEHAVDVAALEVKIAHLQWTSERNRDPRSTFNPMTARDLGLLSQGLFDEEYLSLLKNPANALVVVNQPSYVKGLARLLVEESAATWRTYLMVRLLSTSAPLMGSKFLVAERMFAERTGKVVPGAAEAERWRLGVDLVQSKMRPAVAAAYVSQYIGARRVEAAKRLAADVKSAFAGRLRANKLWSIKTRSSALAKLDRMRVEIAIPSSVDDYSSLDLSESTLLENYWALSDFYWDQQSQLIGSHIDFGRWEMDPLAANATYSFTRNTLYIAAGLLQAPLFSESFSSAKNFGGLGAIIGHEIAHGFDDQGSEFDENGTLLEWWTPAERAAFRRGLQPLINQFSQYEPLPGVRVNGALTVGENFSDVVGLQTAFAAFRTREDADPIKPPSDPTNVRMFFLAYAQSRMQKVDPAALRVQLRSRVHAPEQFRVNGVVGHLEEFIDAYGLTESDPLFIPRSSRVGNAF